MWEVIKDDLMDSLQDLGTMRPMSDDMLTGLILPMVALGKWCIFTDGLAGKIVGVATNFSMVFLASLASCYI